MTDIAKIAAGLSEAMRRDLLAGVFSDDLARHRLCWFRAADIDFETNPPSTRPARWEWRKTGLAVREYLESQDD